MSHLHLNEPSLICDMCLNKITYLLTFLLTVWNPTEFYRHVRTKTRNDLKPPKTIYNHLKPPTTTYETTYNHL